MCWLQRNRYSTFISPPLQVNNLVFYWFNFLNQSAIYFPLNQEQLLIFSQPNLQFFIILSITNYTLIIVLLLPSLDILNYLLSTGGISSSKRLNLIPFSRKFSPPLCSFSLVNPTIIGVDITYRSGLHLPLSLWTTSCFKLITHPCR